MRCLHRLSYGKGHLIKLITLTLKNNVLIIVPRVTLVRDLAARAGGSIYCASLGEKTVSRITVATKQSLNDLDTSDFALVILDEVHNYTDEFLDTIDSKFVIGLTATPFRVDGFIYGEGKRWDKPVYEYTVKQAIEAGILCNYKIYGTDIGFDLALAKNRKTDFTEKEIKLMVNDAKHELQVKEIVESVNREKRKKVVILCANIEHATLVNDEINKYEKSMIVHSKLKNSHDLIEDYKANDIRFMTSVLMLSEGVDIPIIDGIVLLRPTRSTRLMMQALGRGLRLFEGKEYCIFWDYGSVIMNCGTPKDPMIIHGDKANSEVAEMIQCEACHFIFSGGRVCPDCGHEKEIEKVDVDKNLKASVFENFDTITVTRKNLYKNSVTKNGSRFITLKKGNLFFSLFGHTVKQFWGALKKSEKVEIAYVLEGKYPKIKGMRGVD